MTVTKEKDQVRVHPDAMIGLITETFVKAGCELEEATTIGQRLTGANLRGHDSHGVIRTPRYVEWLEEGRVIANKKMTVEQDAEAFAVVNGNYGFGQSVGEQAIDLGVEKARKTGVGIIALKNAGHLGRIGDWAERAAAHGMASIHMVNVRGSLLVAPFGGIDRRGSTSPFCMGVPLDKGEDPIILDFATSLVAEGKALVALRGGKPLPDGSLVDESGQLTSDPQPLYGQLQPDSYPDPTKGPGALTGFGMHKGSGLNFFMEMMAGALTGSGTSSGSKDTEPRRFCNGMLSVVMSVELMNDPAWFSEEIRNYVEFYKSSRATDKDAGVLIPGEKEKMTMVDRTANGLPLPNQTWMDILGAATKVGLDEKALSAILGADYAA